MPDSDCRIAKLEQRMDNMDSMLSIHRNETEKHFDNIEAKLDGIQATLNSQKGFISAAGIVIGAMLTGLATFIAKLIGQP